jgi:hypothetical protein
VKNAITESIWMTMTKIRLLLIEDNRLLRDGILKILKPHKDIAIIAASGDGKNILVKIDLFPLKHTQS